MPWSWAHRPAQRPSPWETLPGSELLHCSTDPSRSADSEVQWLQHLSSQLSLQWGRGGELCLGSAVAALCLFWSWNHPWFSPHPQPQTKTLRWVPQTHIQAIVDHRWPSGCLPPDSLAALGPPSFTADYSLLSKMPQDKVTFYAHFPSLPLELGVLHVVLGYLPSIWDWWCLQIRH